jgi:lysophospholipase L1-like esterase
MADTAWRLRTIGFGLFLAGAACGVLVQKHYGVGRILAMATPARSAPAAAPDPESTLPKIDPAELTGRPTMVALVFGQSNAANVGESRAEGGGGVFVFHAGKLHPAIDPLPGAAGSSGSVWTRLGRRVVEEDLAEAVVFVPVAVGGTPIARWAPGGDLHPRLLETLESLSSAGVRLTHLLWHKGESDADRDTSPEAYRASFESMLAAIRERGIDAPVLVSVATLCRAHRPNPVIRQAQQDLVDPERGIHRGPDTDALGYAYRYDGCHFSTEGLEAFAEAWLDALNELVGVVPHSYVWPGAPGAANDR